MNPVQHPRSYAHTYIHTELFSHKIALHTRQPHDLHLSVSGHRNPSIEPVLNPNLSLLSLFTFFFCSAILSFHGNGSPCSRQFGKKTDNGNRQVRENCLVEILVGNPRFGCRFAMKFGFEARKWQRKKGSRRRRGEGRGGEKRLHGVYYRVGQGKFLLESHAPLVSSFFRLSRPSSLKECKCCDSGSKGRKLFVYGYGEMVICKSICMPSLRVSDTRS